MEQQTKRESPFKTVELAYIALGASLITVCAWITVPFTVPFTMQIFAVFFSLVLLGGRDGTIAIAVYLLLGTIGIPVFSGGKGGFSSLIGMTGGYLWGMLLIGGMYWFFTKLFGIKLWTEIASLIGGLLLCYLFGTIWFSVLNADRGFASSLMICVVPFLLPDAAKLVLALVLGRRLRKYISVS
ncbi:MAG: biotin transporter BioY [Clostridia bacterium]|nr:biotin transporter BioY [Clostridia bacterium]